MTAKLPASLTGLALLAAVPIIAVGLSSSSESRGGAQVIHSAPGPVAGLGLPALLAAGAFIWYRNRSKRLKT